MQFGILTAYEFGESKEVEFGETKAPLFGIVVTFLKKKNDSQIINAGFGAFYILEFLMILNSQKCQI